MNTNTKLAARGLGALALALAVGGAVAWTQDRGPMNGRGFPGRSPIFAALDADHDGTISPAEIGQAPVALKTLDRNSDGQLTIEELRPIPGPRGARPDGQGQDRRGPGVGRRGDGATAGPQDDDLVTRLMAFDTNKDGALSRTELPARMQGLFARADSNKDDILTADELKASAAAQPGARGPAGMERGPGGREGGRGFRRVDPLVAAIDADRDGTISDGEIASASSSLASLDTNRDGQLTADEIRPAGRGRGDRNPQH